jgi:carbon-monoxide dehydrogenase medium subunit
VKAPDFDYVKPDSIDRVHALIEEYGDDARILAGGQSLLAALNLRLSEPRLLIDISGLEQLRGIKLAGDTISIGALTRHCEIEVSPLIAKHAPLLALAAPHIGHQAIRNRGTLGGSLAHADPSAEWPACVVALDATIVLMSRRGERRVKADDFFLDLYTTARAPDEILMACEIPSASAAMHYAFDELARRRGDFAIVGLALAARMSAGKFDQARLVFFGTGNVPVRAREAEKALAGRRADAAAIAAAQAALSGELRPGADLYHCAETKQHLANVLTRRLLQRLGG